VYVYVLHHLLIFHLLYRILQIVRLLPPATVSEDEESDDVGTGPIDGEGEGEEEEGTGLGEGSAEDQGGEKEDSLSDKAAMKGKNKGKGKGKEMSRPRGNSIVPVDSDEEVRYFPIHKLNRGVLGLSSS
jgi:hypothetical protein